MDSLKYHLGLPMPCPILLRPASGPPLKRPCGHRPSSSPLDTLRRMPMDSRDSDSLAVVFGRLTCSAILRSTHEEAAASRPISSAAISYSVWMNSSRWRDPRPNVFNDVSVNFFLKAASFVRTRVAIHRRSLTHRDPLPHGNPSRPPAPPRHAHIL
jgi:hypothetical protein